ncbi:MAG: DUF547 domain-containing protein, partial [Planctomycetota bacterium]|nr:DUF547 domain-containing protein [Planctomycetota bacterium]
SGGAVSSPDEEAAEDAAEPEPEPPAETRTPAPKEDQPPVEPPAQDVTLTYADVLDRIVTDDGLVRYDILAQPPLKSALDASIRRLAAAELPEEEDARLALWCNAYNANVLAMALAESRRESFVNVLEVPGFFDRRTITVAGETMTLNELENDSIRRLNDPRIHAALVCAAMSCPPLRREPYVADRLDEQLNDQCRRWVNDPSKFRMVEGKLGMNEILNWYGEDFRTAPYGNEVGFVLAFAKPSSPMTGYVLNADEPEVVWIPYDWTLNQAPAPETTGKENEHGEAGEGG